MNPLEWRAVIALGALYALRMAGLFAVLPVFALYARDLPGAVQPWQVGLAIGVYGLTQAILQIPLGWLSDRVGRKPVIAGGMLVFAAGSLVAGLSGTIEWITVGRALQGAGAISSAVAALLSDVTRDSVRTTAMAVLGAGMGLAFVLSLVAGPIVAGWIGVPGIFLVTSVLAVLSLPLLVYAVPTPAAVVLTNVTRMPLRAVLADRQLLRLDGGIFLLHACMTALFTTAPLALVDALGLPGERHWEVYLPILLLSLLPVFPLIRWAETSGRVREVFVGAVVVLGAALLLAAIGHARGPELLAALLLFFVAFNYLEGALPSLISRRAPASHKGAALGLYSTAQFLGAFAGGALGGVALQGWGIGGAFAAAALLPFVWLSFAGGLRPGPPAHPASADAPG